MCILSFFKKLFGIAKKEVKIVVETKVEPAVEAYVKQKIQEIDVEKATKAIETRLAEIATEKKVTAKEIKAKVKTPDTVKPVKAKSTKTKATTEKVETKPVSKPRKKAEPKKPKVKKEIVGPVVKGKRGRPRKDPSELKTLPVYKPTGGKRGRRALDPELKAAREAERLERAKNSNGKRGRPKKA